MQKLKDKKIEILAGKNIAEPGDRPEFAWAPIHTGKLWAYVRQLSQKEFWAAKAVTSEEQILFIVNWRNDITTKNCILYNGNYYNIIRVDTFEGYKTDLQIYADGGSDTAPAIS